MAQIYANVSALLNARMTKPQSKSRAQYRKVSAAVLAQFEQKESAALLPATNERLAAIWPAWCALPIDFDSGERDAILTGRHLDFGDYGQHYNRLTKNFKKLLPLAVTEYRETLKAAEDWWRLMIVARSVVDANKSEIEKQLRYESFDKSLIGFMAAYRMHKEFAKIRPDLLVQGKCPTLKDLNFVNSRHAAYLIGRRDAVEILSGLIFVKELLAERNLPFELKMRGKLELRFYRHLLVARLKAYGKCSVRLFDWFMKHDFVKLTDVERAAFHKECESPVIGREEYIYLRLWAWLAENAPVFNFCKTGWPAIFNEVVLRFNLRAPKGCRFHPSNYETLKIQWRDFTISHGLSNPPRISLPIGPPRKNRQPIPSELLTPVPDFSNAK